MVLRQIYGKCKQHFFKMQFRQWLTPWASDFKSDLDENNNDDNL